MMKPLCVFGILDNEKGHAIAAEMRQWLNRVYDVYEVTHDGKLFEYPAMKGAQDLSLLYNRPVLYIHTRGAVNVWKTTVPTRRMWAEEFGVQWQKYFTIADRQEPIVVCPFVDYDRETRYNGFVANPAAWRVAPIHQCDDRMKFEKLWKNDPSVRILGTLIDGVADISAIRKYLYANYGDKD